MPGFELHAINTENETQPLIVVGIDASGKTTFLNGLSENLGFTVLEPTSTPDARLFKERTIDKPITAELVNEREVVYLRLNAQFSQTTAARILAGENVACTGSSLVTRLSHAVMRQLIGVDSSEWQYLNIVKSWINTVEVLPKELVFTHAPFGVIRDRITKRQEQGQNLERFWGFNSPFFLDRYQNTWHQAIETITAETDVNCIVFDTSVVSPSQMLELFASRKNDG